MNEYKWVWMCNEYERVGMSRNEYEWVWVIKNECEWL